MDEKTADYMEERVQKYRKLEKEKEITLAYSRKIEEISPRPKGVEIKIYGNYNETATIVVTSKMFENIANTIDNEYTSYIQELAKQMEEI